MNSLGKKFPYSIVSCPSTRRCTVWLNSDYKEETHEFAVTFYCVSSGEKKISTLSRSKPFVEFDGLTPGEAYLLTVKHMSLPRQFIYKSHREKIIAGHAENSLRAIGVGSGRCGTTSLAAYLNGMMFSDGVKVDARHESAAYPMLYCIINKQGKFIPEIMNSFTHNIEIAPYFWLTPDVVKRAGKVVQIIRDGRLVVTSGMTRGWYTRNSLWDEIKPEYSGGQFEHCCHYWVNCCKVLKPLAHVTVRCRDMQNSSDTRLSLLRELDIKAQNKPFPKKNLSRKDQKVFEWQDEHHEIFHRICGHYMDEYYPGWQSNPSSNNCI